MPRTIAHLAVAVSLTSLAGAAYAQGLPDARTGAVLPNAQGAAVEEATALLVNPAGLAYVEGSDLDLGLVLASDGLATQTDADSELAFSLGDGFTLGLGSGLTLADGAPARLRGSAGLGLGGGPLAIGSALHVVQPLEVGRTTDVLVDFGGQLRPARFLAFGAGVEGLGQRSGGVATGRVGVSVRPGAEWLTVGVDARLLPGASSIGSPAWLNAMAVVPALAARVELGGFAVTAGASVANLGLAPTAPPTYDVLLALEVNGEHVGARALGGAVGIAGAGQRGAGGVRLRASSAAWESIWPAGGRWEELTLSGDGAPEDDSEGLAALFADNPSALEVLAALHAAADDPDVSGVLLKPRGLSLGWARLAELRGALVRLKESGKKVVVHLESGDDADLFLASAADKIYLVPSGHLAVDGLRAELSYFARSLEKIGVQAEAVAAGRYKSAPRAVTHDEPSPEELEVENALLDGVFSALVDGIATGRGLAADDVKALIDRGGLTATAALEAKVVDGLCYEDELEDKLEELAGHKVMTHATLLSREARDVRWDSPPHIAVIPVIGSIAMHGSGGFPFGDRDVGADDFVEAVERAAKDDDVKAIVLRIDSPGGDALASDLMWRAVTKARDEKPVIASMGDVAASGGYYVAAAAQRIFAEDNTITGSIGVFGLLFNVEGLADELGVRSFAVERGANTGPSLFHPLNDGQRRSLEGSIDATYDRFLDAIVTGRGEAAGLDKEGLRKLAEGRVWTGAQALERKLVDERGGVLAAIAAARDKAGIAKDEPVVLDVLTSRGDPMLDALGLGAVLFGAKTDAAAWRRLARLLVGDPGTLAFAFEHEGRPLALLPAGITVE
ncbi:MAG: signal peptide peptidase SppA [Deltaproteobacteria bacterium]|nr:signal peptide peptidase SppA [Deltaproteobacteria bacterium]